MCGRYTLYDFDKIQDRFNLSNLTINLRENYNISPSQINPVITRHSPNQLEMMSWGFIPEWAKDKSIGFKMINARGESLLEKPTFARAFKERRCLVPANGFYEWQKTEKEKIPYLIRLKDEALFAFAGLYSLWQDSRNNQIKSYTIITTWPNQTIAKIHNRMPIIIAQEKENLWLDKNTPLKQCQKLLKPYPDGKIEALMVSKKVNSPKNNSQELTRPIDNKLFEK